MRALRPLKEARRRPGSLRTWWSCRASEKSLSELTLRSTSLAKEALLSTSTASSWSPPARPRAPGLWWCKHRDRRGADPEDEDHGQ